MEIGINRPATSTRLRRIGGTGQISSHRLNMGTDSSDGSHPLFWTAALGAAKALRSTDNFLVTENQNRHGLKGQSMATHARREAKLLDSFCRLLVVAAGLDINVNTTAINLYVNSTPSLLHIPIYFVTHKPHLSFTDVTQQLK